MYVDTRTTPLTQLSKRDRRGVSIASEMALNSEFGSSKRLGACILVNGQPKCVFSGYNQKSRTRILKQNCMSVHAEVHALAQYVASQGYKPYQKNPRLRITLYVVRLMRDVNRPEYGISKPCKNCQSMLKPFVHTIKYTDVDATNSMNVLCTMK